MAKIDSFDNFVTVTRFFFKWMEVPQGLEGYFKHQREESPLNGFSDYRKKGVFFLPQEQIFGGGGFYWLESAWPPVEAGIVTCWCWGRPRPDWAPAASPAVSECLESGGHDRGRPGIITLAQHKTLIPLDRTWDPASSSRPGDLICSFKVCGGDHWEGQGGGGKKIKREKTCE